MKEGGVAFVGIGEANTDEDDRVKAAVHEAISSPLLGDIDLKDAKGALIRIVGGPDMTISEAQRAAEIVTSSVNERARIIWGCSIRPQNPGDHQDSAHRDGSWFEVHVWQGWGNYQQKWLYKSTNKKRSARARHPLVSRPGRRNKLQ